jgi:thioredoxin 1
MSEQVRDVNDGNFETEVMRSKQLVLVDFWAEWCAPCRMMTPVVQSLAEKYQGRLSVVKVNVDENTSVTQRFGIKGVPTLIVFKGGKEAERLVGATNEQSVARLIEGHLGAVTA